MNVLVCLIFLIFLILTIFVFEAKSYRILAIYPLHSRSHNLISDAVIKGSARRGHQVDVFAVFPLKKPIPNYKLIRKLGSNEISLVGQWDMKYAFEMGEDIIPASGTIFGNDLCEYLALPEIQQIIKNPPKDPPYDLLITEAFAAHCFIGVAYSLNIPVVFSSGLADSPWLDEALGLPVETAYFPTFFRGNAHPMTFFERIDNTVMNYITYFRFRRLTDDVQNAYMKKYIDPNIPTLRELEKSVPALCLVNTYHSIHGVRPLTPSLVEVAGIHVFEHYEKMPKELEKWMNESTDGVVYFTLGSMVQIETLSADVLKAFYSVFKKFTPIRVLMKIVNSDKLPPGVPENVRIASWIPQVAVLEHKNIKAFITHGGLMGSLEALTFAVPMIGIPLFADQFSNVELFVKRNITFKLSPKKLTEDSIYEAMNEVLNNPKYRNAAKIASHQFLDRPLSAMDTAMFWIEYAIRHGSSALRSPAVEMPWWQSALIDVYAFLLISMILIISLLIFIVNRCLKIFIRFKTTKRVKLE